MIYGLGLLIAVLSIVGSILHLHQAVSNYFDVVGICVVLGGTIAVGVITLPWENFSEMKRGLRRLFSMPQRNPKALVLSCIAVVRNLRAGVRDTIDVRGLPGEMLRDGSELSELGVSQDKIEAILMERIMQSGERASRVANSFRGLSKYPPAFGLVGTVLGLVSLMRAISDGAGSQETGVRMAVALVSTLYGLLVSNLILNPAGEHILRGAHEEKKDAELALQAVLLAIDPETSLLEAQEMLNSFVDRSHRVNLEAILTTGPAGDKAA